MATKRQETGNGTWLIESADFLSQRKAQIYGEKQEYNSYKNYCKKQKQAKKNQLLYKSSPQRCSSEKVLWKCAVNLQGKPLQQCDFNKFAIYLCWNHTSARLFSCKFAAYLQKPFRKNTCGGLLLKLQYYEADGFNHIFCKIVIHIKFDEF